MLDATFAASSGQQLRDALRAAFAALRAPRARPVYVEIPLDLLSAATPLIAERFDAAPAPLRPPVELIEQACSLLAHARRPLIIAGGGARAAAPQLRALVETLDAFLITTAAGKGLLPEQHPANLGASLPYPEIQELAAQADVVIAVGTELGESDLYSTTRLPLQGKLIRIDVDQDKVSDHYGAVVGIRADAAITLEAIGRAVAPRAGWRTLIGAAQLQRVRLESRFDERTRARWRALDALRAALPADALLFTDMTQIAYLGNYAYAVDNPGAWFHPSGYGTLGYALPAAIGAKLAAPRRAVLALAGDFGLQFTLQELMTAVELDLNVPIVVWNNAALGQIRDDMLACGIAPVAVVAQNPDFVALAAACGATGLRVASPAALTQAVRAALERRGPTLIEAHENAFLAG